MRSSLRRALNAELDAAFVYERSGEWQAAFVHLERAHVLSQRHAFAHTGVHWRMLRNGWLRRDWREVRGQLTRIPAALLFSRIWVPAGNTGGANVSPLKPMPVPDDLRAALESE